MSDTTAAPQPTSTPVVTATPVPTTTPAPTAPPVTDTPAPSEPPVTDTPAPTQPPETETPAPTETPVATATPAPTETPTPSPTVTAKPVPPKPTMPPRPPAGIPGGQMPMERPQYTPEQIRDRKQFAVMKEALDAYRDGIVPTATTTPKALQMASQMFANAIETVLNNPTDVSLDHMWKFFVANKDGALDERNALQGIESLSLVRRKKVEVFYTVMRKLVSGGKLSEMNMTEVRNTLQSPGMIAFLSTKSK